MREFLKKVVNLLKENPTCASWLYLPNQMFTSAFHLSAQYVLNHFDLCIYLELIFSLGWMSGWNGFTVKDKLEGFYHIMKDGFTNMWSPYLSRKVSTLSHSFLTYFTVCDSWDISLVISLYCTDAEVSVKQTEKQTSESSTFFLSSNYLRF